MNNLKVLILVLSVNDKALYSNFFKVQKKTWDSIKVDGIETLYFFGNSKEEKIQSNRILLKINESIENCGYKTIKAFELTKFYNYDYIFRTNSSSYIDKEKLYEYLKDKPRNSFYSGVIGDHLGIKFASGSGYIISRDLVNIVLENSTIWNHDYIDDVSLGLLLQKKGYFPVPSTRFDIYTKNFFHLFFNNIPINYFHYRLKSKNRLYDVLLMKRIFKLKQKIA